MAFDPTKESIREFLLQILAPVMNMRAPAVDEKPRQEAMFGVHIREAIEAFTKETASKLKDEPSLYVRYTYSNTCPPIQHRVLTATENTISISQEVIDETELGMPERQRTWEHQTGVEFDRLRSGLSDYDLQSDFGLVLKRCKGLNWAGKLMQELKGKKLDLDNVVLLESIFPNWGTLHDREDKKHYLVSKSEVLEKFRDAEQKHPIRGIDLQYKIDLSGLIKLTIPEGYLVKVDGAYSLGGITRSRDLIMASLSIRAHFAYEAIKRLYAHEEDLAKIGEYLLKDK